MVLGSGAAGRVAVAPRGPLRPPAPDGRPSSGLGLGPSNRCHGVFGYFGLHFSYFLSVLILGADEALLN